MRREKYLLCKYKTLINNDKPTNKTKPSYVLEYTWGTCCPNTTAASDTWAQIMRCSSHEKEHWEKPLTMTPVMNGRLRSPPLSALSSRQWRWEHNENGLLQLSEAPFPPWHMVCALFCQCDPFMRKIESYQDKVTVWQSEWKRRRLNQEQPLCRLRALWSP